MKKPINKCKDKSFVKIPGVSGYLINKKGEIFSEFKGEVMKPALRSGYHFVVIMTDTGKRVNKMIHRLMAETFLPNPEKCRNKRKRPIETAPDRPFAGKRSI